MAALLTLLVACSSGADSALGDVVLREAAPGFDLVSGPASGVMDRDAAPPSPGRARHNCRDGLVGVGTA